MKIGYVRISTKEQNTARQDVLMEQLGVERIYTDKMSGKDTNRPGLEGMMDFVREGDTVIVESFSRFARNTQDLLNLTSALKAKGVQFVSQKENIDTNTHAGKFMLSATTTASMKRSRRFKTSAKRSPASGRLLSHLVWLGF